MRELNQSNDKKNTNPRDAKNYKYFLILLIKAWNIEVVAVTVIYYHYCHSQKPYQLQYLAWATP